MNEDGDVASGMGSAATDAETLRERIEALDLTASCVPVGVRVIMPSSVARITER